MAFARLAPRGRDAPPRKTTRQQDSKTKEQHMSTLKRTMIVAVVAALDLAAPFAAKAAAD